MARDKSYPKHPITLTFHPGPRTKKVKKKTFKNRNIDEVIEGLENGTLPGVPVIPAMSIVSTPVTTVDPVSPSVPSLSLSDRF